MKRLHRISIAKKIFPTLASRPRAAWMVPAMIALLNLTPSARLTAQTFTTLHSFTLSDGTNPSAGLITSSSDDRLYGVADSGGGADSGAVFAINTDGTSFTNLYAFTALIPSGPFFSVNSDGGNPRAGLILSGQTLYGTARSGGRGFGTVFAVNTDGSGFTNLHNFNYNEGAFPAAALILAGATLYGTTGVGGGTGGGTVFAINTDGGFTNLHNFSGTEGPANALVIMGATLYGTTFGGGAFGVGSVFSLDTTGTGFTNLYSFTAPVSGTNSDGSSPAAGLILSGNVLYGTASAGGSAGGGTVFSLHIDGAGFTNLHSFNSATDGSYLRGRLTLSGNTLYGTAASGGSSRMGTLFALNTNGSRFTILHNFTPTSAGTNTDGASPQSELIRIGNVLYGTASQGAAPRA